MKPKTLLPALIAAACIAALDARGAGIDMDDPLRAVAREGDVRIDAQLLKDTVSQGAPIAVTYQIQNFSAETVAIAAKVADASYDHETRTIVLAIGSEVPVDGNMPQMITIAPGEKKILRTAATPVLSAAASSRGMFASTPRFVQVKVTILRELAPFAKLIDNQSRMTTPQALSDELFDQWFESSDTILLNTLPVQWAPRGGNDGGIDAERRQSSGRRGRRF